VARTSWFTWPRSTVPIAAWWRVKRSQCGRDLERAGCGRALCVRRVVFAARPGRQGGGGIPGAGLLSGGWTQTRFARPTAAATAYGISKAFGEIVGRSLVDETRIESFVAVRIGFCPTDPLASPSGWKLRSRWIGHRTSPRCSLRCVEADFTGHHVVYGVSGQPEVPYDLTHTKSLLSWTPVQIPPLPSTRA